MFPSALAFLFFLLNNQFKIIHFRFVLHLVRSANTAAWSLWMWAGTCHTLPLCWPLISQPPTVQRSSHYCRTFSKDYPHQNVFDNSVCSIYLSPSTWNGWEIYVQLLSTISPFLFIFHCSGSPRRFPQCFILLSYWLHINQAAEWKF